ncbi:MAG: glycosyltransferase family 1 protein [Cellvibrionales bacterium]|nr:glycosyltransferase family 1 protein [Cellvibrionales bacterium]
MKLLFLVQKEQRVILDRFYDSIGRHAGECDIRWLDSAEQADLKRYFREQVNPGHYDRILFFLRFKKEMRQWRFIRTLPNLAILEHDAYQNYIPNKYAGKYARHYHRMPWVRVLSSGAHVTQRLQQENIDAVFIPKGYDQALIQNQHKPRTIELGFVGSLKSGVYQQRKAFLESLAETEKMEIVRTKSGQDYVDKLNSIRFFISADIGMGEYMIKNFEAMAAGCVLFGWRQGNGEEETLGFHDMENIVLYSSMEECREKIRQLRADPALADRIALAGQTLVEQQYSFDVLGRKTAEALQAPLRRPEDFPLTAWQRLFG